MIMNDTVKTEYGCLRRAQLEKLETAYDTRRLLEAVDLIDEIRGRLCDPQLLRRELLHLHAMAHMVINDGEPAVSHSEDPIWAKAADLEMEISDYAEKLSAVADLIQELALLAPDDIEDDGV